MSQKIGRLYPPGSRPVSGTPVILLLIVEACLAIMNGLWAIRQRIEFMVDSEHLTWPDQKIESFVKDLKIADLCAQLTPHVRDHHHPLGSPNYLRCRWSLKVLNTRRTILGSGI